MSRSLTTALKNETTAAALSPVMFALFDFQSGAVRVWSGLGSQTWDGNSYLGVGYFGSFSPVEETADVKANGVAFQLSGVPSSLISTVLGDNYQGRTVKLWLGAVNAAGAIVADPYLVFSGRMDAVEIDEGGDTSTIRVLAESRLVDLQRSRERRFTHEDQQIDFAGDEGLAFMPTAQSTPFVWGGQKVNGVSGGGDAGGSSGLNSDEL